ncbi:MAG: 1-deoxy-D-xylulose-5-phosphate synthase [Cellulosilyticaceae bacterium]
MLKKLDAIKNIEDLKKLPVEELPLLAKDIRKFLIHSISKTGGHLASNLGVVELTIAMHYVFNSPKDEVVFDVGHQAYVHKLLTGRRAEFKSLRQYGGMSGFPKCKESPHDVFETGHSSTSISAALGLAVARDLRNEDHNVMAVIGDGALSGGMAYEALNNAGRGNNNLIVILNDNEMSISENVGGMGKYLNHLRSTTEYARAKEDVQGFLGKIPLVGNGLVHTVRRTKESIKTFIMANTLFEEMGFTYLGPIDGHDFEELIEIFENAKELKGPILIHIKTKKGKGYKKAEENPSAYHGVGKFNVKEGVPATNPNKYTFSNAFGNAIMKEAENDKDIVAITAAMAEGTGLQEFSEVYKDRFFDVGIAEQHAVTFAAGLAIKGFKPIVAIYSSFLQRAFDQILHDVALQNLPVVLCVDRAGLVGEDGSTHQGIFDIGFLSLIPNMTILSPKMPEEVEDALRYALTLNSPVAIRYPRGATKIDISYKCDYNDPTIEELEGGSDCAILATGKSVQWALAVRELLLDEGIMCAVIEVPCIWPMDVEGICSIAEYYPKIYTIEDHILTGGFGSKVMEILKMNEMKTTCLPFAYADGIVEHGDVEMLLKEQNMSSRQIATQILEDIKEI